MKIRLLDPHLVDQIAAGEVIERPASVVKELVENALDAGAKRVEIDLAEGGKRSIRVADDGAGIEREDLPLAFASHATSKIRSAEDLAAIATLGFRGEALASIGAVSRAKILSRPCGAALGARIENVGGNLGPACEAGAPYGTTVEVRDLFFNLPARRKFLKTASAELSRVVDLFFQIALPFEGVEFVLKHEGKRLFRLPAEMDLCERLRAAFGGETVEALVPVQAESRWGKLSGFLGLPRIARADASRQFLYLNGRFIRDRALARALREAYRELLPHGRQPVAFLFLGVDPAAVDQNVHPTKVEVRFREGRELFGFFLRSLREALEAADLAAPGAQPEKKGTDLFSVAENKSVPFFVYPTDPQTGSIARDPAAGSLFPSAKVAGPCLQIHDTYLVRETPEGFEVIDQHALHERVLFEEFKEEYGREGVPMQRLLVPELVEAAPGDLILFEERGELLRRAGFEIEPFGERTLALRGVPARLRRVDAKALVEELAAAAREESDPERHPFHEEVLHRAACRAAVMAGDRLSAEEVEGLLARAGDLSHDQTCPHSRPTRVRFTLAELERAFQRR